MVGGYAVVNIFIPALVSILFTYLAMRVSLSTLSLITLGTVLAILFV